MRLPMTRPTKTTNQTHNQPTNQPTQQVCDRQRRSGLHIRVLVRHSIYGTGIAIWVLGCVFDVEEDVHFLHSILETKVQEL